MKPAVSISPRLTSPAESLSDAKAPPPSARGNDVWSRRAAEQLAAALVDNAPTEPQVESHLHAAISESVVRPGKLVRARLVWATTRAHVIPDEVGLLLATAIEYFHLASLLLDDLPCMDDAATRRGRACIHHVHGEATAILAALAFINRAHALTGFALSAEPEPVRLQAQAYLDACLGTAGMVGGQARDLRFAQSDRSPRHIGRIALGKTGGMLWLALLLPSLLASPTPEERRALEALCIYWSLAFQAVDDVHDVLSSSIEAGKTTRRDRSLSRPNLAVALGFTTALRRTARLLSLAETRLDRLTRLRPAWGYLREFQHYLVTSSGIEVGATPVAAA